MLRPDAPNAAQLLGTRLVLWRDGGGVWRAHEDVCPHRCIPSNPTRKIEDYQCVCYNLHRHVLQLHHKRMFISLCIYHSAAAPVRSASRLAPLSEGRLQDGQLQCTYHGAQAANQSVSLPSNCLGRRNNCSFFCSHGGTTSMAGKWSVCAVCAVLCGAGGPAQASAVVHWPGLRAC